MFKVILTILFIFISNRIFNCQESSRLEIFPKVDFYDFNNNFNEEINYVPYTSTVKFSCISFNTLGGGGGRNKLEELQSDLLLHGNEAWNFPEQDIELNINYPTKNDTLSKSKSKSNKSGSQTSFNDILTKFDVILYIKGHNCQGFVNSGGVLQQSISLSFKCTNVTSMAYQFWLYGMEISSSNSKKSRGGSTKSDYSYTC